MEIKYYQPENLTEMLKLFCDTVHTVNAKDYTPEQREAWAPYSVIEDEQTRTRWNKTLSEHLSLVAWQDGKIAGFADLDVKEGYLDRMYVGEKFVRQGIATTLERKLEQAAREAGCNKMTSDVSITARPFFEKRGYRVVRQQEVERKGVILINFKMEKEL